MRKEEKRKREKIGNGRRSDKMKGRERRGEETEKRGKEKRRKIGKENQKAK